MMRTTDFTAGDIGSFSRRTMPMGLSIKGESMSTI